MNHRATGTEAEDAAATYLLEKGYTLVTRRHRLGAVELDLVCLDGDTLVFVEVKRRSGPGIAEDSIGKRKIANLRRAAERYLASTGELGRAWRFDVIAIDRQGLRHHVCVDW